MIWILSKLTDAENSLGSRIVWPTSMQYWSSTGKYIGPAAFYCGHSRLIRRSVPLCCRVCKQARVSVTRPIMRFGKFNMADVMWKLEWPHVLFERLLLFILTTYQLLWNTPKYLNADIHTVCDWLKDNKLT